MFTKIRRDLALQEIKEREALLLSNKDRELYEKIQLKQQKIDQENEQIFRSYQEFKCKKLHSEYYNNFEPDVPSNQKTFERVLGKNCFCFCCIRMFCCFKQNKTLQAIDYSVTNSTVDDFEGLFNSFLIFSVLIFGFLMQLGFSYTQLELVQGDESYWKGLFNLSEILKNEEQGTYTGSQLFQLWYLSAVGFTILTISISFLILTSLYFSNSRKNKYIMQIWARQFTWIAAFNFVLIAGSIVCTLGAGNALSGITRPYYCWDIVQNFVDDSGNFYDTPQKTCQNWFQYTNMVAFWVIIILSILFLLYIYCYSLNIENDWECFTEYQKDKIIDQKQKLISREDGVIYENTDQQMEGWLKHLDMPELLNPILKQKLTLDQLVFLNKNKMIIEVIEKLGVELIGQQTQIIMSLSSPDILEQFDIFKLSEEEIKKQEEERQKELEELQQKEKEAEEKQLQKEKERQLERQKRDQQQKEQKNTNNNNNNNNQIIPENNKPEDPK